MRPLDRRLSSLLAALPEDASNRVILGEPLAAHTTLRVGGPADAFLRVDRSDELAVVVGACQESGVSWFLLGGGSNVCVSDAGVRGLVVQNAAAACEIGEETAVDTGHGFMRLFQRSAAAGLSGLEFAVGIPGTVGGALVSNAGAYRQSICELVTRLDVVEGGERKLAGPEWMGFSYRDSRLRRPEAESAAVVRVFLRLRSGARERILARARDNQRQRISKQPWYPSAGSFFKNVYDSALAQRLPDLPASMKDAGVVPAGYLSAACDCRGLRIGGAEVSHRHGNFVVNRGGATASDIRAVADAVKQRVREQFGVALQEEVLYVGDWQAGEGRRG